jgi:hypothetical protein
MRSQRTYKERFFDACSLLMMWWWLTRAGLDQKPQLWRQTLESKDFRLSKTKTEYIRCQFSGDNLDDGDVSLDGQVIPMNDTFRYLRSMLQNNWWIDENVSHRIRAGWVKWRQASGILRNKVLNKLKGKYCRVTIRLTMMYDAEYWATKGPHIQKMSIAKMWMLRWICGHTRRDQIKNYDIRDKLGVAPIQEKLIQHRLRWLDHIQWSPP